VRARACAYVCVCSRNARYLLYIIHTEISCIQHVTLQHSYQHKAALTRAGNERLI